MSVSRGLSIADLALVRPEPRELICGHWLRKGKTGESVMIYAPSGVGKSYLAMTVAANAAQGRELPTYPEWKADRPFNVTYLDSEMDAETARIRFSELKPAIGDVFENTKAKLQYFGIDQQTPEGGWSFCDSKHLTEIWNTVTALNTELLVIDTLSGFTGSKLDGGYDRHWPLIQRFIASLKKRGVTVLIIHHTTKEKTNFRGGASMEDQLSVNINLVPTGISNIGSEICLAMNFKKGRHLNGQQKQSLHIEQERTSKGIEWRIQPLYPMLCKAVEDMTQKGKPLARIKAMTGFDEGEIIRIQEALENKPTVTPQLNPTDYIFDPDFYDDPTAF